MDHKRNRSQELFLKQFNLFVAPAIIYLTNYKTENETSGDIYLVEDTTQVVSTRDSWLRGLGLVPADNQFFA